jgi:hypothetical protein
MLIHYPTLVRFRHLDVCEAKFDARPHQLCGLEDWWGCECSLQCFAFSFNEVDDRGEVFGKPLMVYSAVDGNPFARAGMRGGAPRYVVIAVEQLDVESFRDFSVNVGGGLTE